MRSITVPAKKTTDLFSFIISKSVVLTYVSTL